MTPSCPGPFEVAVASVKLFNDGVLWKDLTTSVSRAAVGFTIGATLGVLIGILTARVAVVRFAVYPFFNILRPIPAIALVPIAIVWFGIGEESKYFVIAYTVFLAVWLATHHGMGTYPKHISGLHAPLARPGGGNFWKLSSQPQRLISLPVSGLAQHWHS